MGRATSITLCKTRVRGYWEAGSPSPSPSRTSSASPLPLRGRTKVRVIPPLRERKGGRGLLVFQ